MIGNDNFKKYIKENGKQISLKISYDNQVIEKKGIHSFKKTLQGDMFKSIMQYIDLELDGKVDIKDKLISIDFGVSYDNSSYEYIHWGKYLADSETIEYSVEKDTTKFTAYDLLVKTHIQYDLDLQYPLTIRDFLLKICKRFDFELVNNQFVNESKIIQNEKFIDIGEMTFRDVLDQMAGCTASTIIIYDNKLELKYPQDTGVTIDEHNIKSMNIQRKFGPVNSVVLSREPQEDNYFKRDELSIKDNGLTEIRFANNELMDKNREDFIDEIYNQINGYIFYPYEISTFGFCYFEPCDIVSIKDLSGHVYQSLILNNTITIGMGLDESFYMDRPESATTDYSKATSSQKELHNTQLIVDKQNKMITAEIEEQKLQIEKLENTVSTKISLNYVNQQTYDEAYHKYYPDYSVNPLVLTAITKDAIQNVAAEATYIWKRKGTHDKSYTSLIENEITDGDKLNISHNMSESVEYIVYAEVKTTNGKTLYSEDYININLNTLSETKITGEMCSIEAPTINFVEEDGNYNPGNISIIPHFFNCYFDTWSYSIDLGMNYKMITPISTSNGDESSHIYLTNVTGVVFNDDTKELQISQDCECFDLTNVVVFKLKGDAENANATIALTKMNDVASKVNQIITDINQLNDSYMNVTQKLDAVNGSLTSKVENIEKAYNEKMETIVTDVSTVEQSAKKIQENFQTLKEVVDENGKNLQSITTYIRKTKKGIEVGELEANIRTLMGTSYFAILFNEDEVMKLEQNLLTIERIRTLSIFQLGNTIFKMKDYGFDITWGGE